MSRKFSTAHLSWPDRFALVDHYNPTDDAIMEAFDLTAKELETARQLRSSGTFTASSTIDVDSYDGIFYGVPSRATNGGNDGATVHARPETATRKVKTKPAPQKRGRKGDKITNAFLAAPTTPVPVTAFMEQHGVSLAVLRQAKRFIDKMDADTQAKIGKVVVKQDKVTKQLMISRVLETDECNTI